jgi:2,4-dienoyl-CoA reductase-like NADH-dependent reductase (Old Yellow Enzyme family)
MQQIKPPTTRAAYRMLTDKSTVSTLSMQSLSLPNRVVMAPMTRAKRPNGAPGEVNL